ncbi:MAG: EboA domain-containing protein [Planctomycetes bacterium]|nr:EboA domain-containing protein [Planctomycetota bacterium]
MSTTELRDLLGAQAARAEQLLAELREDRSRLPVLFPGLARKFGKDPVGGGRRTFGGAAVDLDAFRTCDLVAAFLCASIDATADELVDVFSHGDIEERTMLLRSLSFVPLGEATRRLLVEVLRTNVVLHLEAALCDQDVFARAIAAGVVDADTGNRLLLKFAFLDMPLQRAIGAEAHASAELSTMLQDLATEREAAGRSVWRDTWRMLGRAPCPGALARLIGGLEHGDDGVRLAAAEGLLLLPERGAGVAHFAKERLPREPRANIRELLERLAQSA